MGIIQIKKSRNKFTISKVQNYVYYYKTREFFCWGKNCTNPPFIDEFLHQKKIEEDSYLPWVNRKMGQYPITQFTV